MNSSIDQLFNPGKKFLNQTFASSQGWQKEVYNIFYRAIVLKINISSNVGDSAPIAPPYSIQAKIIIEDVSTTSPKDENSKWIPPFYSSHIISLPEVGEEVWVIRESTLKNSRMFWLNRVSDSNFISKVLCREFAKNESPVDRYGFPFKVEDIQESVTQTNSRVYSIPAFPGDVIIQGRTDTFIRQSFNPKNKEGVLEFGIKERREYLHTQLPSIGTTQTKTVHAVKAVINDLSSKLKTVDDKKEKNIIYNEAQEIYNISNISDDPLIYRHILGEKQNIWLTNLLQTLQNILNINISLLNLINSQHKHSIPEFKETKTLQLSVGDKNISVDFDILVPKRDTTASNTTSTDLNSINEKILNMTNEIKQLNTKLENNLSEHNFVN